MPSKSGIMELNVTIDKAGRIVIPKKIREELRLGAGDSLTLEYQGDYLTLRPVSTAAPMRKEHGIWVFHGGEPISLEQTNRMMRDIREERDRRNAGERGR
jgi:AbrB family looped-hinge helix DNA binding protein